MKTQQRKTAKWLDKAIAFQQAGDLRQAAHAYRRYLRDVPEDAAVLHTLGGLYYQEQDHQSAAEFLEKAHRADPDNLDYLNDLGAFRLTRGDYEKAIIHLMELVKKTPGSPQAHYNLGLALHGAERLAEAIDAFEQAIRLQPEHAAAHYNLGVIFQELGHFERAEETYRKVIRITPDLALAHLKLGEVLTNQNRDDAAMESFHKAHELDNDNPKMVIALAESLHINGRTGEGIKLLRDAQGKYPEEIPLMTTLGKLLHIAGQINEAEAVLRRAMSLKQDTSAACLGFSRIRKFSRHDADIINAMEALLENNRLPEGNRMEVCYALGKIYDDCDEYDKAFARYNTANAIQHKWVNYDRHAHEQRINDNIAIFNEAFFSGFSDLGTEEERPIFIVGMPRSGTTLTEQIIVSHPEVGGAGELEYFRSVCKNLSFILGSKKPWPRCCLELDKEQAGRIARNYLELLNRHSATVRYVTDKLPHNYLYLGIIRLLFPLAPIILCRRDPLDVCLSIFFQNFAKEHKYAFDLMDIGHHYLQYARLMAHWRRVLPGPYLESRYEDLIADQEARSREVIAFCGLEWDEACLEFYNEKRDIRTASNWQVRQPIYSGAVKRWKHYERHLAPLMKLFADTQDEL
ncbi:MAG: sulfotransferase [Gammaproteobacteria bacterium]|nr:sulfotransferase [Gammaproteobacteria bacterium]